MSDIELLRLAAKAAGYTGEATVYPSGYVEMGLTNHFNPHGSNVWRPLTDDGDALRLAVKLRIWVDYDGCSSSFPAYVSANYRPQTRLARRKYVNVYYVPDEMFASEIPDERSHALYQMKEEGHIRGIGVATRRAIVLAAAEIGKAMTQAQPCFQGELK